MIEDEARTADLFDRYLDSLGRDGPAPDGLDPMLAATARYLGRLAAASPPPGRARELLERHLTPATARGTAPGGFRLLPRFGPRAVGRATANVATAALVLLTLLGALAVARSGTRGPAADEAPSFALHVSKDRFDRSLVPIDPVTLEDRSGPVAYRTEQFASWGALWAASADGSTVVAIGPQDGPAEKTDIVVFDGATGDERLRFHPTAVPLYRPYLSRDGSRLVVETERTLTAQGSEAGGRAAYKVTTWQVYDTATGRLRSTQSMAWTDWRLAGVAVDPWGWRLYHVQSRVTGAEELATEPRPMMLWDVDLITGSGGHVFALPGVPGGPWPDEQAADGVTTPQRFIPGFTLSPDGRRLAIVHADKDAVTLVDAERMEVERTIELRRPTGWRDRLLAIVPLVPQDVEAKQSEEGVYLSAVFGPDGRYLYVTGTAIEIDDAGRWDDRTLGMRVIDVEQGVIMAELAPDASPTGEGMAVLPSPDGDAVYVMVPKFPERSGSSRFLLRRLDATTLRTLAEREVEVWSRVLLTP